MKTYAQILEECGMETLTEAIQGEGLVNGLHYSDNIINELKKMGWKQVGKGFVSKPFDKLGLSSNVIGVGEKRNMIASFNWDDPRRRFLQARLGDKIVHDMDMRPFGLSTTPEKLPKMFKDGAKAFEKLLKLKAAKLKLK